MSAIQFAIASSSNQTVKSPRRRSPSLYSAQLRTWYFFCFACLYWQRLGYFMLETYLGHHHRRISLSARAVQQRRAETKRGSTDPTVLGVVARSAVDSLKADSIDRQVRGSGGLGIAHEAELEQVDAAP